MQDGMLLKQARQISEYEKALATIYRNTNQLQAKALIESLAERYQGDLKRDIEIIQEEQK